MKLKIFVYTLAVLLLLVLQSTVLEYLEIYNVKPNLMIILIIAVALLRGNVEGAAVGLFAGFVQDMMFGKLLGFYALLGFYLGAAVGTVNRRLYRENYFVMVFFVFISTILYEASVHILSSFMDGRINLLLSLGLKILPEAIYNSIISFFIYAVVIRLNHKFEESSKAARKY